MTLLFMAAACGQTPSTSASASPDGPDRPVETQAGPSPAVPVGDTLDPRKVQWSSATPAEGGRSLDLVWWSGVEPCNVLDRVEVDERTDKVIVTLYEGRDRRSPDAVCIEIAIQKTTRVELRSPLDGRQVVDGAR
ncbi:hypothetical protein ACQP1K_02590 [Sphaerimonospora sp. CA-214678]|uniref:hypothetical protein n=1 Tax=Sphaerimonospora sp. CA-214678 TaxID=3240029 RepID=UPI003D8C1CCD